MRPETLIATAAGLAVTAIVAIVFRFTTLDIDLQALAYEPGAGWPHAHRFPWKFLHDFGTLPGLMLALAAIIGITASFLSPRFARWRFPAFYVFVLTALGPGLLTNIFGKILAGRPRPEEVAEFGGAMQFLHPFEFGTPGRGFSFLCGHCSMGYLFVAFFFLARDPRLRWLALVGGSAFGLLLGIARVAAGAHFPSDIVLAGTLTFTLAALLSPIARMQPDAWRRRKALAASAIGAAIVLLIAFSFSTPINRERTHTFDAPREIVIDVDRGDVEVVMVDTPRQPLSITSVVKGFGFPGSDGDVDVAGSVYGHRLDGFLWEAHVKIRVAIPRDSTLQRIRIATADGSVTAPRDPRIEIVPPPSKPPSR